MSNNLNFKTSNDVLQRWLKRARESQLSHHLMSEKLHSYHTYLGVAVIGVTGIAGATTIASQLTADSKLVIGLFTLFATILSGLQTFLKLEEKANRHRLAGAAYGEVRRKLEFASTLAVDQAEARLIAAENEFNKLARESPVVSKRILDQALKRAN